MLASLSSAKMPASGSQRFSVAAVWRVALVFCCALPYHSCLTLRGDASAEIVSGHNDSESRRLKRTFCLGLATGTYDGTEAVQELGSARTHRYHPHPSRVMYVKKYKPSSYRKHLKMRAETKITVSADEPSHAFTTEYVTEQRSYPVVPSHASVCTQRTAGDLLERALTRIGDHLFLTSSRLDHFLGTGYFDPEFASKYLYSTWSSYLASRQTETFGNCAIVGNSGHLALSEFGKTIDAFDAVIRTNQAPTKGYGNRVGSKTTFRLMNRAMARRYHIALEGRYKKLRSVKNLIFEEASGRTAREASNATGGDPTLEKLAKSAALKRLGVTPEILSQVPVEGGVIAQLKNVLEGVGDSEVQVNEGYFPLEKNTTVVLVTEATSLRTEMEGFIRAARKLRPDVTMLVESGRTREIVEQMLLDWYIRLQTCHGVKIPKGQGARPTTGVMALITMLKQCNNVTLFGFGPAANGTEGAPYHYYADCEACMSRTHDTASSSVHYFDGEAAFIRQLQAEGRVRICSELDSRYCGLSERAAEELRQSLVNDAAVAGEERSHDEDEDLGDGGVAVAEEDEEEAAARDEMQVLQYASLSP